MTREQWIASFAREAGVEPPSRRQARELLELAAVAAHASERTAAPLACWIAGRSGHSLAELRALAAAVGEEHPDPGPLREADPAPGPGPLAPGGP